MILCRNKTFYIQNWLFYISVTLLRVLIRILFQGQSTYVCHFISMSCFLTLLYHLTRSLSPNLFSQTYRHSLFLSLSLKLSQPLCVPLSASQWPNKRKVYVFDSRGDVINVEEIQMDECGQTPILSQ